MIISNCTTLTFNLLYTLNAVRNTTKQKKVQNEIKINEIGKSEANRFVHQNELFHATIHDLKPTIT